MLGEGGKFKELGLNVCFFDGDGVREGLLGNEGAHTMCSGVILSLLSERFSFPSAGRSNGDFRKDKSRGADSLESKIRFTMITSGLHTMKFTC